MRKITFVILVALAAATVSSFAGDTKPLTKTPAKCTMGGACCKQTSRAAMMKAKPVKVAATVKKA